MRNVIAPLVGMHFRPPAKWVLAALPAGVELILEPEPENPYDPLAIKVLVEPQAIPESQRGPLAQVLVDSGFDLGELLISGPVWLGYVARTTDKCPVGNAQVLDAMRDSGHSVRLGFGVDGKPTVVVTTP